MKRLLISFLLTIAALPAVTFAQTSHNGLHTTVNAPAGGSVNLAIDGVRYVYVQNGLSSVGGSISTGLVAAGTTTTDALVLTTNVNVVATTASSTGVRLPVCSTGVLFIVRNSGANTLNIFPETGGTINGGSANAAITLATTKTALLYCSAALTAFSLPGA